MLYQYWREAPNRMSEQERRNFAAITLGIPGGDPGGRSTATSTTCGSASSRRSRPSSARTRWTRCCARRRPARSATSRCARPRATLPSNLSLHGYGMAHYAARELQEQIKFMIKLLQRPRDPSAATARATCGR